MTTICLLNKSQTDLGNHLDDIVKALQTQNTRDVVPAYSTPVTFVTASIGGSAPDGAVIMLFTDAAPPDAGAEGDHEVDDLGRPLINIWVPAVLKAGDLVSVTASHEAIEEPADEDCSTCIQDARTGWFWPKEPCDAVETLTYECEGVQVSNFVLPAYFSRAKAKQPGAKLDFMEKVKAPFTVLGGGYSSVWRRNRWDTVWGEDESRARWRHSILPKRRKRRREAIDLLHS